MSKPSFSTPYSPLMSKSQDILLLTDTRISQQKYDFILEKFSLADQINVKKKRFFSTKSDNSKTGGASIYFPPCYDNVLNIIYEKADCADIPRFISVLCCIVGGPSFLLTSFYGCPGKTSEKAKVFRRLYSHLYEITTKFGISILILGGDFNQNLNDMSNSNSDDKRTFHKLISDFLLTDAFLACPPELSKKDEKRLSRQDQIAHSSEQGFTYFPRISGNKKSRLDSLFFSSSLEHNLIEKSFCLSLPHPYSDHLGAHFSFAWNLAGMPANDEKPRYHFHNSLLSEKRFVQTIKRDIANTILDFYSSMGGVLERKDTDNIELSCLESILFDRAKNNPSLSIPSIDIIYEMLSRIEKSQNCFLKSRTNSEKKREQQLVQEISKLESIRNPKRSEQRLLNAALSELSDHQKRKIRRLALDSALDYQTLGEFGTKYFLRCKVARRNKSFIREFEKPDGQIIYDSYEIEKQFYDHFKCILETPDPFCKDAFYDFINPILDKFGRVKDVDRVNFNKDISTQEVGLAIKRVRAGAAPGADGCSGRLLIFLQSICPRLFCHAINTQILKGKCEGKEIMIKRIIFIPKPGVNKKTIKKFRPISLLSSILKLADTCVVNRLVASLDNAKILPPYMYAYRAGFSTTDAILSLQTFIDNANHTGRKLVIINWDVSAAFDKCSRLLVIECLKILGCSDFLLEAFSKMPTGAVARICVNLAESRFPGISAPYACPQGQNSSGQLFGIGLFSLLLRLNNSDISSYKIDLCIQKDISPVEAFTEIQWKLDGNTGPINKTFKQNAKEQWSHFSRTEKRKMKDTFPKRFHDKATCRLLDVDSTICYSDDGHLFIDYTHIDDILNVMNIFYKFGSFSGLKINPDKTKIITLNFTLSTEEINHLTQKGFNPEMICDGNQYFRFLGCDIKPNLLKDGATLRLNQICDDMENIADAFNNNCTLKGRRLVCESLMISKLQAVLTSFDLNEKDMCRVQKIIDKFVHRKKISAGKRKYLSFAKAGLKIPKYYEKYLVARVCLLKSLFTKIAEAKTIPTWGIVLLKALRFIGFSSPTLLFRSFGQADIKFIVKNLKELGLHALSGLFKSAEIINNILERRRCGQERRKDRKDQHFPDDLTCLSSRIDFNSQVTSCRNIVGYRDKFGRFRNVPDPPSYRSVSMVGCLDDDSLQTRNKQSLLTIWKNLQPNCSIPAFEFSARNVKELSTWILNCAASPNTLLDENNQISPSSRIIPLTQRSNRQYHIFYALAEKAQTFCMNWTSRVGPSSPNHKQNILSSWISARTMGNNGRSLYYQFLDAKYGHEQSSAIKKLSKIGISGKIDNVRIGRALDRGVKTFNSAKMERATIEISLCAMRGAHDISRINSSHPKPCFCCGIFENNHNLLPGGIYQHFFIFCAPAAFLQQFLNILTIRTLGFPIELNLNLLIFNEIPHEKCKLLSDDQKKIFFCLLNSYKATLYGLYYLRPHHITGNLLLYKFQQNINVARKIAQDRNSDLMSNIDIPQSCGRAFLSYQRIKSNVINLTSHLRRFDNMTHRALYLQQNSSNSFQLNANIPRPRKALKSKPPSLLKKQILIQEAFARIPNKKFTNDGNLEMTEQ